MSEPSLLPGLDGSAELWVMEERIHVWHVHLECLAGQLDSLWALLSADERARAERFRFERDRVQYASVRGVLRRLLAVYCGAPAVVLKFTYSERGKPALAPPFDASGLEFSVSHSSGRAVLAISRGRPVGVDVELLRHVPDVDHIVEDNFSPQEVSAYQNLPESDRLRGFFQVWTRKEAFVKAIGQGLSHPLHTFSVIPAPDDPTCLVHVSSSGRAAAGTVTDIPSGPRYVAALAVEGTGLHILTRSCSRKNVLSWLTRPVR